MNRARVLEVGITLLAEHGEAGLGFNRVARALGIRPPSLYNHVSDGAALRRLIAVEGWRRFADKCERTTARLRGAAALRAIGRTYRAFAKEQSGLFALMEAVPLSPDEPDFQQTARDVFAIFETALRQIGVADSQLVHVMRMWRAAVHGFVTLEQRRQFGMAADIETSFQLLLETLLRGAVRRSGKRGRELAERRPRRG